MKITYCAICGATPGIQNSCFANRHDWCEGNSPYCSFCGKIPGTPSECTAQRHYWMERADDNTNENLDAAGEIVGGTLKGLFSAMGLGLLSIGIYKGLETIANKNDRNEIIEFKAIILALYNLEQIEPILTFEYLIEYLSIKQHFFEENKARVYLSNLIVDGILLKIKSDEITSFKLNPENEIVKAIANNNYNDIDKK